MKMLVFVLNDVTLLDRVVEAYAEAGIPGATILDSEGMGRFLAYEVPLFADFKEAIKGSPSGNKTLLAVVKDEDAVARLMPILQEVVGDLDHPGNGILFTVPVDWIAGRARLETEEGQR